MLMARQTRLAIMAAAVLVLVIAGGALANRAAPQQDLPPQVASSHEAQPSPSADGVSHAADRLANAGLAYDQDLLVELATEYGVGGAVRLFAWSDETGLSVDELRAMRDEGTGWGVMARELGVHPGIGSIMGNGGGHGRENAPGQQRDRGSDD
jgi:hypothetical protein